MSLEILRSRARIGRKRCVCACGHHRSRHRARARERFIIPARKDKRVIAQSGTWRTGRRILHTHYSSVVSSVVRVTHYRVSPNAIRMRSDCVCRDLCTFLSSEGIREIFSFNQEKTSVTLARKILRWRGKLCVEIDNVSANMFRERVYNMQNEFSSVSLSSRRWLFRLHPPVPFPLANESIRALVPINAQDQ